MERKLLRACAEIRRVARSIRGGPSPDAVQAAWVSTTARGDAKGVTNAIRSQTAIERRNT